MPTSQEMYELYLAAEQAVLRGQTVRLGERWLSLPDLQWIIEGRKYWERQAARERYGAMGYVITATWSSGGPGDR